jgi:hypothetical protein
MEMTVGVYYAFAGKNAIKSVGFELGFNAEF